MEKLQMDIRKAVREDGAVVFPVAPGRVERDLEQWQPIVAWLER